MGGAVKVCGALQLVLLAVYISMEMPASAMVSDFCAPSPLQTIKKLSNGSSIMSHAYLSCTAKGSSSLNSPDSDGISTLFVDEVHDVSVKLDEIKNALQTAR